MIIQLYKFGTILISRPDGREAFLAFQPTLRGIKPNEQLEVDFTGVDVFSVGWADEFITPLFKIYPNRITLLNLDNASVKATLEMLGYLPIKK